MTRTAFHSRQSVRVGPAPQVSWGRTLEIKNQAQWLDFLFWSYSELSLLRTPTGPALAVHLIARVIRLKESYKHVKFRPGNHVHLRELSALQWCLPSDHLYQE